jgi:RNA polymerase sigma-70 factor (ECF subfamily)
VDTPVLTSRQLTELDALFEVEAARLYRLCLQLTGNRADAEDALQECFLAAREALAAFRGEARPETWLYRIAFRVSLRLKAKRRLAPEVSPGEEPSDDPHHALIARDEAQQLMKAMQSLSAEHRAVLALFAVDGLSHKEIATILGIPEGTVWSRLHLARKKLLAAHHALQSPGAGS